MTLVMYILQRNDLKWPQGSIIAQACHATSACLHKYRQDPSTVKYLSDLENMRKVVLQVNEEELNTIERDLVSSHVDFYTWIEQPENIKTAIALKPAEKKDLPQISHLKLFK